MSTPNYTQVSSVLTISSRCTEVVNALIEHSEDVKQKI